MNKLHITFAFILCYLISGAQTPFSSDKIITVKGFSFTMKLVEGGSFQMGLTSEQDICVDSEKPVHNVTLNDFYMGEVEVTQALWKVVMGTSVSQQLQKTKSAINKSKEAWRDIGPLKLHGEGSDYPIYYVSWDDCQEFIQKLNQLTGMKFRLPTEAEWEYAARGGKKSRGYEYAGSDNIDEVAWYSLNSGKGVHNVRTKKPNEIGLYDMTGNVLEWCSDYYDNTYYEKSPSTNPKGPSSGTYHVLRGGAWGYGSYHCCIVRRNYNSPNPMDCPDLKYGNCPFGSFGFRLALSN